MARKMTGWVKLHRKVWNSWIIEDDLAFRLFFTLVIMATRENNSQLLHKQQIALKRGELVTSLRELALKLKASQRSVEVRLKRYTKEDMIRETISKHGRIISIVNFGLYQQRKVVSKTEGTPKGTQSAAQNAARRGLLEEEGEDKRSNKKPPISPANEFESVRMEARRVLNKLVGGFRKELSASEVRASVGERGWAAMLIRYPNWDAWRKAYCRAYEQSPTMVEGQFREALAAALLDVGTDDGQTAKKANHGGAQK